MLGFETSERVMRSLPRLARYRLYYSELSILEALWKISKYIQRLPEEQQGGALERVREGLEAVEEGMERVSVTAEAASLALRLRLLGHRDMVDNLLYATALSSGLRLLTVDEELRRFIASKGLPAHVLAAPEEV